MRAGIEVALSPLEGVVRARSKAMGQATGLDTVGALEVNVAIGANVD